jgi:PadR family transcriptional regulator PadR
MTDTASGPVTNLVEPCRNEPDGTFRKQRSSRGVARPLSPPDPGLVQHSRDQPGGDSHEASLLDTIVSVADNCHPTMPQDDLLPGTLNVLTLQILQHQPSHGWRITQNLKLLSRDVLRVQQGSLYPALHKSQAQGWIRSEMEADKEGRTGHYYSLTAKGVKHPAKERERWERLSSAVGWVLDAEVQ